MLNDQYLRIPLEQIHVRPDRQRRTVDVSDLLLSIRLRGVIQPIIVSRSAEDSSRYELVAGERRLKASRELGLETIPCRLASELSITERQIIELEENIKRKDLSWQDEALAIQRIHNLYLEIDPDWTQVKTGAELGFSGSHSIISIYLQVAEEIQKENKNVLAAGGLRAAYNIIARRTGRAVDDAMNDFLSMPTVIVDDFKNRAASSSGKTADFESADVGSTPTAAATTKEDILNEDFHNFASHYNAIPFNLLHCDFPYGINHHNSDQGGSARWGGYQDNEAVYWDLCNTLCIYLDNLLAPSAHIVFWLSSDIERQHETLNFFLEHAPSIEFQTVPLYWLKTDNRGILPDPKRAPRRIVETALLGSRGDRHIIKPVSNAYGAPSSKEIHQSEKPEPMLRYFFQMLVDENTRMLDPTCGSATSLRAAESLGAKSILGLEIDKDMVEAARVALRKSRVLRHAQEVGQ